MIKLIKYLIDNNIQYEKCKWCNGKIGIFIKYEDRIKPLNYIERYYKNKINYSYRSNYEYVVFYEI